MTMDVRFKSNSIPKADTLETEEIKNETTEGSVNYENETWGIEVPGSESSDVISNPFDAYLMDDTIGLKAANSVSQGGGLLNKPGTILPSVSKILEADGRAKDYVDVILQRYQQVKSDLESLRNQLVLVQMEASETPEVLQQTGAKIDVIDRLLPFIEAQVQECQAMLEDEENTHYMEFRDGIDYNGDGRIGRGPGSYGIKITPDGKRIYIDPTTGAVLDRPPFSMPEYDVQFARGEIFVTQNEEIADHPAADLTLQIKDPSSGDFDSSFESKFNTAYENMVPEFIWVERDSPASFDPKMDFRGDDFENFYTPSGFEQGADGIVRQIPPEDRSRYVQVQVAKVQVSSEPSPAGDGFDHYITYMDRDLNVIMRIRITGFDSDPSLPWADPNGRADASNFGFALNMDRSYSAKEVDMLEFNSTTIHRVQDLEDSLGLPTDSSNIDSDKGADAFSDNMALFEEGNPTTHSWDVDGETPVTLQRDASEMPSFNSTWGYDAYMSQEDAQSKMADLASDGTTSVNARENFSTLNTGVFVFGQGARGHFIGSRFNDVFEIADANAVMNDEEYTKAFPHLEPLQRDNDLYKTVVEGGLGNNILVQKGGGDLYANGITFAWVDSNRDDTVHIATQGSDNPRADMDEDGDVEEAPINFRNYIHVDAPSGNINIYNPLEEIGTLEAHSSKEAGQTEEFEEAPVTQSYIDDYYDIRGGLSGVRFSNIDDPDVIRSVGQLSSQNQGSGDGMGDTLFEMIELVWDKITAVEQPDDVQTYVDEWMAQSGHTLEMQNEMNSFFDSMFGMSDDFLSEIDAASIENMV